MIWVGEEVEFRERNPEEDCVFLGLAACLH